MQITNVGDDYAYATFEGNEGDPWEFNDKDCPPEPIEITGDLLKANVIKPTIKDRHNKLKAAFNDYRDLNTDLRNELEELGFEISSEGKHHKLTYYGDSRYQTTLAKTSSDYRSGMNAVSVIIKNMM